MRWIALVMMGCCGLVGTTRAAGPAGRYGNTPLAPSDRPRNTEKLKLYDSPYYQLYTDLDEDAAREAVLRMTKMAEEYHARTASFSGVIDHKLPFYLFAKREDYIAAGGRPDSAGVFTGQYLMGTAIPKPHQPGSVSYLTWHVVQHEGFHQFAAAVIRGRLPIWVNEGLAEYFGEAQFTGDGFVAGLIPASRLDRVRIGLKKKIFKSVDDMMNLSPEQWNGALAISNYDQAWSMVHFLVHADNGKYQAAFSNFINDLSRGRSWTTAWTNNFGGSQGFEEKWEDYWSKLPDNPTLNLHAKVSVSALTSFLGRCWSQKQTFDSFKEFAGTDVQKLKAAPADWLPPDLFTDNVQQAKTIEALGASFALVKPKASKLPQLVCQMPDGSKLVGTFTLRDDRIGSVNVDEVAPPATRPAPKK